MLEKKYLNILRKELDMSEASKDKCPVCGVDYNIIIPGEDDLNEAAQCLTCNSAWFILDDGDVDVIVKKGRLV